MSRNDRIDEMPAIYLLLHGELDGWERDFLKSLRRQTEWTDKQRAVYLKIRGKYLRIDIESEIPAHATFDK